jgi:hypothetical protein
MAKAKKISEAAVREFKKNYSKIIKEAVVYATEKAEGEVYTKALSCLAEYYMSYDPESYKRTYNLENAFMPYKSVTKNDTHIISTVGVEYNSAAIDGVYWSGSEKYGAKKNKDGHITQYGHPDSNWILNNYLDGIHPATNGYPKADGTTSVEYFEIIDLVSPSQKMRDYLEKYSDTFRDNVYTYLATYLVK